MFRVCTQYTYCNIAVKQTRPSDVNSCALRLMSGVIFVSLFAIVNLIACVRNINLPMINL